MIIDISKYTNKQTLYQVSIKDVQSIQTLLEQKLIGDIKKLSNDIYNFISVYKATSPEFKNTELI